MIQKKAMKNKLQTHRRIMRFEKGDKYFTLFCKTFNYYLLFTKELVI